MVERSPDTVSGAWVFRGTRVPVKSLFENLEDGATVDFAVQVVSNLIGSDLTRDLHRVASTLYFFAPVGSVLLLKPMGEVGEVCFFVRP